MCEGLRARAKEPALGGSHKTPFQLPMGTAEMNPVSSANGHVEMESLASHRSETVQ